MFTSKTQRPRADKTFSMINRWRCAFASGLILITGPLAAQDPERVTDPEAYVLYTKLLPAMWLTRSKGPLLIQRETEPLNHCQAPTPPTEEWRSVIDNFHKENARVKWLQPMFSPGIPYRFISRAEIEADDARLAVKYPGTWMRVPESMEYGAVSAVGFNSAKTKALLYVRLRSQGDVYFMEKRDRVWVQAHGGCGWIA
jgi:hypothetical protein